MRERFDEWREAGAEAWAEAELQERLLAVFIVAFTFNALVLLVYTVAS